MTESAPLTRLPTLTGLRFIAAAMVFAFHYTYFFASESIRSVLGPVVAQGGYTGVGFFFVLSGFVLAWVWRPGDSFTGFWRRRLFKIFPNHLLVYAVALLLVVTVAKAQIDGGNTIAALLLLQAWSADPAVFLSANSVTWSLSCELLFYLLFPLLMRPLSRIDPKRLWACVIVVGAAIAALPAIADAVFPAQPTMPGGYIPRYPFWFVYFFPPARLLEFVLGILFARLVLAGRRIPVRLGGAIALSIAAYAVTHLFPMSYQWVAATAVPIGLVIAAAAVGEVNGERSWLARPAAVWLGNISFAFYLWHWIVLDYGHRLLGVGPASSTPATLGAFALLLTVTLVLSWLLFTFVEDPILRAWARPRRSRGAQPAAVARVPKPRTESAPTLESTTPVG
jgi:mycarose O-acyltransferase